MGHSAQSMGRSHVMCNLESSPGPGQTEVFSLAHAPGLFLQLFRWPGGVIQVFFLPGNWLATVWMATSLTKLSGGGAPKCSQSHYFGALWEGLITREVWSQHYYHRVGLPKFLGRRRRHLSRAAQSVKNKQKWRKGSGRGLPQGHCNKYTRVEIQRQILSNHSFPWPEWE